MAPGADRAPPDGRALGEGDGRRGARDSRGAGHGLPRRPAAGQEFAAEGVDGLLVLTPYYTNPTQAGIRDYFLRYADASPVPILIYEIPYRTRIAIDPTILHELSRHERIIGMKACNTDMYHFLQVVAGVDESFAVLSGEDNLFPLHVASGARGGIVVTANLLPKAWREIFEAASSGRVADAIAMHRRLIPLMNMAFAETNPGPMKAVMDLIGVNAPRLLAPLVNPAPALSNWKKTAGHRGDLGVTVLGDNDCVLNHHTTPTYLIVRRFNTQAHATLQKYIGVLCDDRRFVAPNPRPCPQW